MARSGVAVSGGVGASWLLIVAIVVGAIWWKRNH